MDLDKIKLFLLKQEIKFKNIDYYKIAFTHSSYVHETNNKVESYERIEFLGDAILGKIIAEYLFKNYLDLEPGDLSLMRSQIVRKDALSKLGKHLNLEKYIYFGKGELNKEPSDSIYEDVLESLIGAIYLDLGEAFSVKYVEKLFKPFIVKIDIRELKDYKTQLQEELQSTKRKTVKYNIFKQEVIKTGIIFHIEAIVDGVILGEGSAENKKKAEQNAAKDALSKKVK